MTFDEWSILFNSLHVRGCWDEDTWLPGSDIWEWYGLREHDYDAVDRMLIDGETIGGG